MLVQEELAEGLHLIDFEQLKIENQSLNEKIEERNEDLVKLRKKTATTVQVPPFTNLGLVQQVYIPCQTCLMMLSTYNMCNNTAYQWLPSVG